MTLEPKMPYLGGFERQIDEKNRLALPSRVREGLGSDGLYLQDRGDQEVLYVLPGEMVDGYTKSVPSPVSNNFELGDLCNQITAQGSITELKFDKQGRTILDFAGRELPEDRTVYVHGLAQYLVIYVGNREQFQEFVQSNSNGKSKKNTGSSKKTKFKRVRNS